MKPFEVDFEPVGCRVEVPPGETLLKAAQRAGVMLTAVCGGEGVCGRCLVRVMAGKVSPPSPTETEELGSETAAGWRLACQAAVESDVVVHVPPGSLVTTQRIQTEGEGFAVAVDAEVCAQEIELAGPTIQDPRSDLRRLADAAGIPELTASLAALRTAPTDLRQAGFRVTAFLRGPVLVGVRPPGTAPLGLAVDIGTTKVAAYLVKLSTGETLARAGTMNPQIAFGEDVMARIHHAISQPGGANQLREVMVEALNGLGRDLCRQAGCSPQDIASAVVVGNTAMHHLFLGLPVNQLGLAPYVAAESAPLDLPASELGLALAPGANVHLLPNIAGFVGADHVAMLLGSRFTERGGVVLGLDIGTNTEISLLAHGRHFSCSTASGPAFEGAHIRHGMRAAPGAIEKVLIHAGQVSFQTVEDAPAVGLCGSGILDMVAQMRQAGVINGRGAMLPDHPGVRAGRDGLEFVIQEGSKDSGAITFSRQDVHEVQLAKGAMRAGVNILLQRAGVTEAEIDTVIIAGAFGTYLDVQSGIDIGMFPRLDRSRFQQVGNAAGTGARLALLSKEQRRRAAELARQVEYVELTAEKNFSFLFARALKLE